MPLTVDEFIELLAPYKGRGLLVVLRQRADSTEEDPLYLEDVCIERPEVVTKGAQQTQHGDRGILRLTFTPEEV